MALPELYANNFATTLAATITTTSATSITVAGAAPAALQLAGQFRVVIDSEILIVTAGAATTTWTVTRGAEGTTAATHANASPVTHILTAASGRLFGGVINVKSADYGAVGGAKIVTDAAITATQSTVTSAQAAFTSADVNKLIYIEGAGANITGTSPTLQATLVGQIQSVTTGVATIQLVGGGALTATTTVTAATAYFGVDDSAAFSTALAAGPVYAPTDIYLWASGVVITGTDVQLFGDGFGQTVILAPATGSNVATASHLTVRGSAGANVTVSADVAPGAITFTTTSSPGVAVGDYIVLTDGTSTFNTWPGGTSNSACRGEMLQVLSVSGAGPFTVTTTGLIHDQYQVNNAARMQKLSMLSGVRVENVEFRCTTPLTTATGCGPMIIFEWCIDAYAKLRVRGNPGAGFQAGACWDGDFYIDAEDLKDGDNLGTGSTLQWWGYGAWASMCDRDCRYFVNAKRVRHAFTTGGQGSSSNPSTHYGVPRNIHVSGIASDCTNAAWDTHADCSDIHFGTITAHGGLNTGLQMRSPNMVVGDALISFTRQGGVQIFPLCTLGSITTNGAITLSAGIATTSGQSSGVVVLSTTTGIPAGGGVITAGGVSIKYTAVSGSTLTGCTVQAVASGTITTAAAVLLTKDNSGNIISHTLNAHIKSIHIHDIFTSGSSGKGIDVNAPDVVIDAAYIHDIDSNGVWLRGTGSNPVADCSRFYFNGRILNPGRGASNGIFIETAPPDVVLKGLVDGANAGVLNGATTIPPRLNTVDLSFGNNVTHPSGDNFSSSGYGLPKTPVGRSDSRAGEVTLVAGSSGAVTATSVTTSSIVLLTRKTAGGTLGHLSYTISAGASFTITSSSGTDTSVIQWAIIEKGAT